MKTKKDIYYAVGAVRVSSTKQGLIGDSPEDQKKQVTRRVEQLSAMLGSKIIVREWFTFIESASGELELQPVQEAINYCKDSNVKIDYFFFKSIDRFTRGGSAIYALLKAQVAKYGVQLVDTYGVINTEEVNTLEHLDMEFKWSKYSPSWTTEILEAERAKSEVRDILTRMIGAEIKYERIGYLIRGAPMGYAKRQEETEHGKRYLYESHSEESVWIIKMFELRAQGNLTDEEIVNEVNTMGFKTRTRMLRDPKNRRVVVGKRGGNSLTVKQLQRYIGNPIYAGVIATKWTEDRPVKIKGDPLVSIKLFNDASKGKVSILEDGDIIKVVKGKPSAWAVKRNRDNSNYPYKRQILCPKCRKYLLGSASRGKMGRYYGAYHCNRGHYFRVPITDFEQTIENFTKDLRFSESFRDKFREIVLKEWNKRREGANKDSISLEENVLKLKSEKKLLIDKIKSSNSDSVIRELEKEVEKIDQETAAAIQSRDSKEKEELDIQTVINHTLYYMEHLEELLFAGTKPLQDAEMFGLVFEKPPTYDELVNGTPTLAPIFGLKEAFETSETQMVTPRGIEPRFSG